MLTTTKCAEIWKISQGRVAICCKGGRLDETVLKGKIWLILKEIKKPVDPRKRKI